MKERRLYILPGVIAAMCLCLTMAGIPSSAGANELIEMSGIHGGMVVHVGCGDAERTAALRASASFLVHGLDVDPANIAAARKRLHVLGLNGQVTVDTFDGRNLPYTDGVVNLLILETPYDISKQEADRVLAPLGVVLVKEDGKWSKATKPWPEDIDEWTHYMHDASNNAVAHDRRIGPPRHLQWQCGPRWSRHHDHMSSVSAAVSTNGRLFYILDEGSRLSPQFPGEWKLIARDAFNGVMLWKRDMGEWQTPLFPLKSGPANLPRRLVANDDEVYATLAIDAPVTAMDAASGETLRTYAGSDGTEELLYVDGMLLALANRTPIDYDADLAEDPEEGKSRDHRTTYSPTMGKIWSGVRSKRWSHGDRAVLAYDAATGRPLWRFESKVIPLTLAADAKQVYFHDGDKVIALDRATGEEAWQSQPIAVWQGLHGQGTQSWFAPTLVAKDGIVVIAGGEKTNMSYVGYATPDIGQDTMTALSADTGEKLWTAPNAYSGYNSPEDLFFAQGKIWTGKTAKSGDGRYFGHDLTTGEVVNDYPPTVNANWFHHRCYRAKATDDYVLCSRNGIEFVDLKTGEWTINHWVRGTCLYGILPCNGLIYSPPEPCACYPEAKINGFAALAPASATRAIPENIPTEGRLRKGPAYGAMATADSTQAVWPTYRGDAARSGGTLADIGPALQADWKLDIGGRLTAPIAADGKVFIAGVDHHAVYCIDETTGEVVWTFTAGGRIDTPPTYDHGRLLFGSADGYVYCLRAADGALAWRFRAAPIDRRLVAFEQVESLWPVHGAVLVQDGVATAVAGRSMFLDGGLRLCRLDVETGRLLGEKVFDDRDPENGGDLQMRMKGLNMPVALPDVLSSDGENLYMKSQAMSLEGDRLALGPAKTGPPHLFAPYGFDDDSWFHRTYWVYADNFQGGVGGYGNGKKVPAGRLLVNNDASVFGYGRKPSFFKWSSILDYHLFASPKPGSDVGAPRGLTFEITDSLNPANKPITIAAWVKPDSPDGTVLIRGANMAGFALILRDGKPGMLLRTNGVTHEASAKEPIPSDEWTHIAGVLRTNGKMEVYVNGKPAGATDNVPLLPMNPSMPMKVGFDDVHQLLPKPLAPFDGAMDDVMLYYRDLSAEEIASADVWKRDDPSRVLQLDFSRGRTKDASGHGNHGKPTGDEGITTMQGPRGDTLVLDQPKKVLQGGDSGTYLWARDVPIMVRAMVLGGDTLLIAGPEDVLDEVTSFQLFSEEATQRRIAEQQAILDGAQGAKLQAVSTSTGETLAEYQLDAPPVLDGMATNGRRVFVSTVDGRLVSFVREEP